MDDPVDLGSELVTHAARLVRAVRRRHDLPAGIRVLSLLDEHGTLGVSALARADRCSQPTMSASVRDLAEDGWVTKDTDPTDARASVVTLTPAGRAELDRVRRFNGEAVAARLAASTTHTVDDLATAVAVLRDLLDGSDPEGSHL
ncbi:MarR family winged helix-turn-helix transcriptional regulator [Nocardioides rubriscoriae]|uniref:MarR family winged helix-turn-helix transcriptional regulator n=1 Tax=Nocardioides rubriscoriae TaxID=642762 RepID=UPI0011DFF3BC|nr:MarR family winged helix-turn-helix transcriptional regulator [Nocardioides rubriscoriae]